MTMFESNRYGPLFGPLVQEERLNELGPGRPDAAARPALRNLRWADAFAPAAVADSSMAEACLSGLWLYYDDLDESHRISQSLGSATGSYWHSLMHRREPDAWNSKYWLDRTGRHPIFPVLCEEAKALAQAGDPPPEARFLLGQNQWDPYRFVDLCEAARTGKSDSEMLCRRIQLAEWRLLFDFCYRKAAGEP
jgi:hypothetical protein